MLSSNLESVWNKSRYCTSICLETLSETTDILLRVARVQTLHAIFLLVLLFNPEDGGDTFLRNVTSQKIELVKISTLLLLLIYLFLCIRVSSSVCLSSSVSLSPICPLIHLFPWVSVPLCQRWEAEHWLGSATVTQRGPVLGSSGPV
jgi:hypothetical protein